MAARTLIAYANGLRMGSLTDENGIWSFTYDAQWLDFESAYALSPTFTLRPEPFGDCTRCATRLRRRMGFARLLRS